MLTRTSEYALRALIHLAQNEERWPMPGNRIAAEAGIPSKYLSKVLGDLVRVGVLESTRGKKGGFRLVRPARQTMLLDVLTPFEQFGARRCPFGNQRCSDEDPCQAHARWKKVIEAQQRFLRRTSIQDVAVKQSERPMEVTRRSSAGATTGRAKKASRRQTPQGVPMSG